MTLDTAPEIKSLGDGMVEVTLTDEQVRHLNRITILRALQGKTIFQGVPYGVRQTRRRRSKAARQARRLNRVA